jgi:hypothetical protein
VVSYSSSCAALGLRQVMSQPAEHRLPACESCVWCGLLKESDSRASCELEETGRLSEWEEVGGENEEVRQLSGKGTQLSVESR